MNMMDGDSIGHNVLKIDVIEVASIGGVTWVSTVARICVKRLLAKSVVSCEIGSHFGGRGSGTVDNERRRARILKGHLYSRKLRIPLFGTRLICQLHD